jgi:CHAT domain-containing protein/tetratricopeptide (TPR) repeat protein
MQQAFWLLLAFAAADDPKVLEVGKGLKISGTLDKAKPEQVYHVKLDKGGTYVIDMISPNPKALDPFLRLLDASGKMLASDDDSGGGLNARILFPAPATGTYQIVATSFNGAGVGPFTLTVKRDDTREADLLAARVRFLRSAGKTSEALAAARELVKMAERLQGWQTLDARWQVRSLEKIAALSARDKAELAEAVKLDTRAYQLYLTAKYAEAAPLFEKALSIQRRILGEEDLHTAHACRRLARNLQAEGKLAEAGRLFEKSLAISCKILGEKHPDTAEAYGELGSNLSHRAKYAEGEPLLEKALIVIREIGGEEHLSTARAYNNLAFNRNAQGKYAEAGTLFEKALVIRRKFLTEEHPETAQAYGNVGTNLSQQGRYAEAAPLLEKAVRILRKILGEENPKTALSYNNLASNLGHQGKYTEAAPLLEKALAINRKILGEEHPETGRSYNNLASNLGRQSKYAEGAALLEKALAIYWKIVGEQHPHTAVTYNNLGHNLAQRGKYFEAAPFLEKALAIRRKILGEEHPDTASSYHNLASNLRAQGKYAEAALLFEKAVAIYRKTSHPNTAISYNNLAANLEMQGKYAEAALFLEKAVAINRKILGEEHPHTAVSYNNLAHNLDEQGKYFEATRLHEKALALWRRTPGEEHLNTALGYLNLANCLYAQGKYAEAEVGLASATRVYAIARLRSAGPGLERALFGVKESPLAFLSACLARNGKTILAWQNLESMLARGLLEDIASGSAFPRPISPDESGREQELLVRLDQLDKQILKSLTAAKKEKAASEQLAKILAQRRQTGEELAKLEAVVAARQVYDLKRIQSRIPTDAALIVWVDIKGEPKAKDPNGEHWACVLRHSGPPAWVKLAGSGDKGAWTKDDDELPERFRKAVSDPAAASAADLKTLMEKLSAQRLAPLAPYLPAKDRLPAVKRLIVVPVGVMAGVPLEALSDDRIVSYVPSGTMWARLQEQGRLKTDPALLAVGDPKFRKTGKEVAASGPPPKAGVFIMKVLPGSDAAKNGIKAQDVLLQYGVTKLENPASLLSAIKEQSNNAAVDLTVWRAGKTFTVKVPTGPLGIQVYKEPAEKVILAQRDAERVIRASRGADFTPLPGSRAEVEAIAKLLPKEATLKLLGSQASEQKLADLADRGELKKYRYLHFATHGEVNSHIAFQSAIILAQDQLPEPAEALRGKNFIDGRLTAAELLNWKLDADMVVLSACQTGLGQPAGGEGYLGFSQALFKAGARSLVVSLWKVDDTATSLLMLRFYENLLRRRPGLKAPLAKAEALAEAKSWLRNLTAKEAETLAKNLPPVERIGTAKGRPLARTARPYEHPYYWAAFILIGDPR